MKFTLEKGRSRLNLEAADHKILDILEGRDLPALSRSRIRGIIETGIRDHAPEDIRDRSVAVIIPDDTRLWARGDLFVPAVIDTLTGLGVDPGRICVIIALGTHRDIPAHGFAALCGEGTGSRVKVINSAGLDPGRLTHIGTTSRGTPLTVTREAWEADHIIIFGGILHHMLAGYGGGRKYILPGIAGESTIMANHALAIDRDGTPHPLVTQAVCRGNPVSEDMQEGADLFLKHKTCTYAAVVANGRGEIFHA
ncbi:MAG: lactate racemase domain-containing protein, partial [Desulfobacterales bacterium]|nr:lactate racemase domain-containing protein [Desulfobacterales bacterium]